MGVKLEATKTAKMDVCRRMKSSERPEKKDSQQLHQ